MRSPLGTVGRHDQRGIKDGFWDLHNNRASSKVPQTSGFRGEHRGHESDETQANVGLDDCGQRTHQRMSNGDDPTVTANNLDVKRPLSQRITAREGLNEEGKEDKGKKDQENGQRPTEGRWESIDDVVTDGGEH